MLTRVSIIPALGLLVATAPGCGLIGPSCLARQNRGTVTTLSGEVEAQKVAVHRVPYGAEGSQNDVNITWNGQFGAGGSRIKVYATRVECVEFVPENPFPASGPCGSIGSAGGARVDDGVLLQTSLVITNGRGNPDILGSPPEYKLWVVGDSTQKTRYTMTITWFYGPDC